MGETDQTRGLSDAAGGRPARGLALRFSLKAFAADQSGATAIEYGLIISLIFLVCVTAIGTFSGNAVAMFNNIATAVTGTR
jgi:pilus assembly protein Flp/PilA